MNKLTISSFLKNYLSFLILFSFFTNTNFGQDKLLKNIQVQNKSSFVASTVHPEAGKVKLKDKPESVELIEKRTESSRSFSNKDGSITCLSYSYPKHFLKNGIWLSINNDIVPSVGSSSNYTYMNDANIFSSFYPNNISDGFCIKFNDGSVFKDMINSSYSVDGNLSTKHSISSSNPSVTKNEIVYSVSPDLSVKVSNHEGLKKMEYIIHSANFLNGMSGNDLIFEEEIQLPSSWSLEKKSNGSIFILDEFDNFIAQIVAPFCFDASTKKDFINHSNESVLEVDYSFTKISSNTYNLKLSVPLSWLKDNKRAFPISVDPTISSQSTYAGWYRDNGGSARNTTISGAMSGSTITSVDFTIDQELSYWGGSCASVYYGYQITDGTTLVQGPCSFTGNTSYNGQDPNDTWSVSVYDRDNYTDYVAYQYTLAVNYTEPQPPVADFSASTTSTPAGSSITFTDASTNSPTSWAWDFGDGNTSTSQNPSNTYTSVGTYTVSLTATNIGGSDTETKSSYITITVPAPVADFSASTTGASIGTAITFTDASTNTPTSWAWDFGDGGTSTSQNPSHSYSAAGTYTVALTATNAGGSDTETKSNYITITLADWTWTGAAGDGDWTNSGNWDQSSAPTSSDNCIFPAGVDGTVLMGGSCNNLTLNAGAQFIAEAGTSLTPIVVSGDFVDNDNSAGYIAGKVDVTGNATILRSLVINSGGELEVDGNITLSTGGYTTTNNGTIDCNGTFDATGGTITQGSSGNIEISSTVTSFGTLDNTSGTVTFDGGTALPTDDYYNLTISSGGTHSLAGNITAAGNLTLSSGTIALSTNTLTVAGASDIDGTATVTTGTFDANGSFNATGGNITFSGAGNLRLGGTVTSLGTFTANSSTVEYDGATQSVLAESYNNLEIDGSGVKSAAGTVSVAGTMTVTAGTYSVGSTTTTVTGATDLNGNLTIAEGTFNADGSFDGTGGTTEFTGGGVLALSSTVTAIGGITNTSSSGTVKYDGTSAQNVDAPSSGSYANLSIENASTKTAVGNIDVDGNLNTEAEASCVLDMSNYDLNVAGNFTIGQRGGLLASNGNCDVTFDGSSTAFSHAGNTSGGSVSNSADGFESFASYWSATIVADVGTGNPGIYINATSGSNPTCSPSEGSYFMYFNSYSCGSGSQARVYKTTSIDASNAASVTVSFDMFSGTSYSSSADGVYVQYSTNGSTWTTASSLYSRYSSSLSDGTVMSKTFTLPSAAHSSTLYVGFLFESAYGDNVYLDNVTITNTEATSSINPTFNKVVINGSDVTLSSPMNITGTLTLTSGNIISQSDVNNSNSQSYAATNTITLKDGATVSGASASSHVVGAVRRESSGTSVLDFPTGDGTNYRPVYLTPAASTATTYTAEFVNTAHSSISYDGNGNNITSVNTGVDHVAGGCWWDIEKSSGGANATIGINWDANSGVDTPADMLLTHWNSSTSKWDNVAATATAGNGSSSASASDGRITSSSAQSDFSPWNLGSSGSGNTLPIDLLSFHTDCSHDIVDVNFSVVSQVNNDYFLIERSTDAMEWEVVGQIEGAGNSNTQMDYLFTDSDPIANLSYYRLTQVDYDGTVKSFYPVSATCGSSEGGLPIDVYPNPAFNEITVELELDNFQGDDVFYTISDATGKIALSDYIRLDRGFNKHQLDLSKLPNGVYVLKFNRTKNHITETRIVKK